MNDGPDLKDQGHGCICFVKRLSHLRDNQIRTIVSEHRKESDVVVPVPGEGFLPHPAGKTPW